jgi:lipoyl-dependent peroxiredoxin
VADQDIVRNASAHWEGDLAKGKGKARTGSGLVDVPYSFGTRFQTEPGSNPEELIGAAHAACFAMQLSGLLTRAGHAPEALDASADVHLTKGDEGFSITRIDLTVVGRVPGIDEMTFVQTAQDAKAKCPVSRALAALSITLDAKLAR